MGTHVFFFNPPTLWSNHCMVRHSIQVKVFKRLWVSCRYCLILIWMLNFPIHSFQLLNILSQHDHRTPHNKILQRKGDMPWANEGIPRSMADWEEEIPAFVLCLGLKQHWWEAQSGCVPDCICWTIMNLRPWGRGSNPSTWWYKEISETCFKVTCLATISLQC
jgi:hypothetical protein